jgi:hypothetical protein
MNQGVIITNNDKVYKKHKDVKEVLFLADGSYLDVLKKSRDLIHRGAKLLSHPMAGSMKPNQTPYRSVLLERVCLSENSGKKPVPPLDIESLRLIESSIETAKKFLAIKKTPQWPFEIKEDFKTIDLSIIDSAIK